VCLAVDVGAARRGRCAAAGQAADPALHPHRAHAHAARGLLVFQRVFHQHAALRRHAQPRRQVAQHARVGLGPQVAEHGMSSMEKTPSNSGSMPSVAQHALGVGRGALVRMYLRPGSARQRGHVVRVAAHRCSSPGSRCVWCRKCAAFTPWWRTSPSSVAP
jgi:hypothetical protein